MVDIPIPPFIGIGAGIAIVSGFFAVQEQVNPPSVTVEVRSIDYLEEDGIGFVRQNIQPSSPISMKWTAQIVRGRRELCAGSGEAPYDGSVTEWELDAWTGDDCPDTLLPTDQLAATWEYKDEFGVLYTLSKSFLAGDP